MEIWWSWKHEVELGDYTQPQVEEYTGCIPLLLRQSIVKGENGEKDKINLKTEIFKDTFDSAAEFEKVLQAQCQNNSENLKRYVAILLSK